MSKSQPQGTHKVFGGLSSMLRAGLVDALTEYKPLERRAPRIVHGPKPRATTPTSTPDVVVLEARRLHEFGGLALIGIQEALRQKGHDVTDSAINGWIKYRNRTHLVPDANNGPYL